MTIGPTILARAKMPLSEQGYNFEPYCFKFSACSMRQLAQKNILYHNVLMAELIRIIRAQAYNSASP